jgi:hypothetical protein
MQPHHVQKMKDNHYWEEVPDDEEILGVVRVFLVPEPHKEPPRWRVIHWTYTVNLGENDTEVHLPNMHDARRSVHDGDLAYAVDVKGCFNQFPYGKRVRNLFCLRNPEDGKWYRLMRLAMGQRQACYIAQTALSVLAHPLQVSPLKYIDNLKAAGEARALWRDLDLLRERAIEAGITFNEDLSKPGELIKPVVEFLGLRLDHKNKTCQVVDKIIAKLQTSWANRRQWTVRNFISHVCVLFYIYNATGRSGELGRYERVLKAWCRLQTGTARRAFAYDDPMATIEGHPLGHLDADDLQQLTEWTEAAEQNPWVIVPPNEEHPDFVLVTDGSAHGWGAVLISCESGLFKVAHATWPDEVKELAKVSANSEPWAVFAAFHTFFRRMVSTSVLVVSDNLGNVHTINKQWSAVQHNHVMGMLRHDFPHIRYRSTYCPGEHILADRPSRGQPIDPRQFQYLTSALEQQGVRVRSAKQMYPIT